MTLKMSLGAMTLALAMALTGCTGAPRTEEDAEARIDSATALNARPGMFRVSDVQVTLAKVVALPDDMLGLRFSFVADSANCCSLFPREVLDQGSSDRGKVPSTNVLLPQSYVGADGTLEMRLWEGTGRTIPFTIDLSGLGVTLPLAS